MVKTAVKMVVNRCKQRMKQFKFKTIGAVPHRLLSDPIEMILIVLVVLPTMPHLSL